jgi:hypothetical protein
MKIIFFILGVFAIAYILRRFSDNSFEKRVSYQFMIERLGGFHNKYIKCSQCGKESKNLDWFWSRSSSRSWRNLAGREGFYSKCPDCNIIVDHFTTAMS